MSTPRLHLLAPLLCLLLAAALARAAGEATPSAPAPTAPNQTAPTQPAPPAAGNAADDDADLPPVVNNNDCENVPHPHRVWYEFNRGSTRDAYLQVPSPVYGSETGQRLLVKGDCFGLLFEDVHSNIGYPNGDARISSMALIIGGEDGVWEGYGGLGETRYHVMGQSYSMSNLFMHLRRHIVWNLSGEAYLSLPLAGMFIGSDYATLHPNDPALNYVAELALRMDWNNLALKYGVRRYVISYTLPGAAQNVLNRGSAFLDVTVKF